jgi:uncharacterized membrane protein YeiH
MLRDVFAGLMPYVFVKHVYACAALSGAVVYLLLHYCMEDVPAKILSALTVVIIRLLATKFRWNLPRISLEDVDENEFHI